MIKFIYSQHDCAAHRLAIEDKQTPHRKIDHDGYQTSRIPAQVQHGGSNQHLAKLPLHQLLQTSFLVVCVVGNTC